VRLGLGARFVKSVLAVVDKIAENPLVYAKTIDDVRAAGVKNFPYSLFYFVDTNNSVVVGCIHQRRDLKLVLPRFPKPDVS
jgi:hypothetical protein